MIGWLISLILIFIAWQEQEVAILACAAMFACAGSIGMSKGE